jgi:hypothetical protein
MALAVDTICFHIFFSNFFALVLMHLVLLARFLAQISTSFSIPSSMPVRTLSQFLLYVFLLYPTKLAWSQVIKQLCESLRGPPVIEISSF